MDSVSTSFVHWFPRLDVGPNFVFGDSPHLNDGIFHIRLYLSPTSDRHRGNYYMRPAGKSAEHPARILCVDRFAEDLAIDDDDRVCT